MTFDIDWSKFLPVVVGIASLIIGWAIGFWDSNTRTAKKIGAAEAKSEAAIQQARAKSEEAVRQARAEVAEAASRAAQAAEKPASAPPPGTSLLRLWLDARGDSQLDLDGQPVNTSQILEPQRKRLIQLLTAMRPWIESKPGAPIPAAAPVSRPVAPPASVPAGAATMPPLPGKFKEEKSAKPLSMVSQIDEILQIMLSTTTFAGRGIRLEEAPGGGVKVVVGSQIFAGVGEVSDPEIQALLRAAIAEWEKRYTPS
jgi:antitoxin component HigA of HigAB toxin-antitoxin module